MYRFTPGLSFVEIRRKCMNCHIKFKTHHPDLLLCKKCREGRNKNDETNAYDIYGEKLD